MTLHPEDMRSYSSMNPRYTLHPEDMRSYSSMNPRYTLHPEDKIRLIGFIWSNLY